MPTVLRLVALVAIILALLCYVPWVAGVVRDRLVEATAVRADSSNRR